ncbi:hypothetical protein G9A89_005804 [Geosiphon pyriformis]|nr:hypothetical protein G9A89_005804 [Geosiphon pyriformis]
MEVLSSLTLRPRIAEALRRSNLETFTDIINLSQPELSKKLEISQSDVSELKNSIHLEIYKMRIKPISALQLIQEQRMLTTGDTLLDDILGGGILSSGITEIVGESAVGKTQLCLQLSLTAQLPKEKGGLGGGTAYLCSEGHFPIRRLNQMIIRFKRQYKFLEDVDLRENINCAKISDLDSQYHAINYQLPVLLSRHNIRLVIIDSISSNFRVQSYHPKVLNQRSKQICKFGSKLKELSDQFHVPIICVNEISDYIPENFFTLRKNFWELAYQQKQFAIIDGNKIPTLGLVWANTINVRIMLCRSHNPILHNSRRRISMLFSPHAPKILGEFYIDTDGGDLSTRNDRLIFYDQKNKANRVTELHRDDCVLSHLDFAKRKNIISLIIAKTIESSRHEQTKDASSRFFCILSNQRAVTANQSITEFGLIKLQGDRQLTPLYRRTRKARDGFKGNQAFGRPAKGHLLIPGSIHWTNLFVQISDAASSRKKRIVIRNRERKRNLTLNALFEQREREERLPLTRCCYLLLLYSRTARSLCITVEPLALPASYKTRNNEGVQLLWEVSLYRMQKGTLLSNGKIDTTTKRRKLNNGGVNTWDYQLIYLQSFPLNLGSGLFTGRISFEIPETNFDVEQSVEDFVLFISINSKGRENWPSDGKVSGWEQFISDFLQKSNNTRILWVQISLLDQGLFIKDDDYESDIQAAHSQDAIKQPFWKMSFKLNWDRKIHRAFKEKNCEALTVLPSRNCVTRRAEQESVPVAFLFRTADCEVKQITKGFRCPWCNKDYIDSPTLQKHLPSNHVHLKFTTKNGKQVPSDRVIVVFPNEDHSELDYFEKTLGILRPKPFAFPIIHGSVRPTVLPMVNFYHSQSFMPFTLDDSDIDSDTEMCTHWLQQISDENLDESTNINNSEKKLMKMWNRHVEPHRGLGDCHLPEVCIQFAKERALSIARLNLRNNFALHLLNLAEYQMIDAACATRSLGYVDRALDNMAAN